MNRISSVARWIVSTAVFCSPGVALSEGPGQPELDRATELQIQAQSMQQLGEVIQLCDAALKKGLDEANQQFANDLLSSTLFQRATLLSNAIFEQTGLGARAVVFWRTALADLERVVALKPEMVSAHLLIARLHGIPGGDAGTLRGPRVPVDPSITAAARSARHGSPPAARLRVCVQ